MGWSPCLGHIVPSRLFKPNDPCGWIWQSSTTVIKFYSLYLKTRNGWAVAGVQEDHRWTFQVSAEITGSTGMGWIWLWISDALYTQHRGIHLGARHSDRDWTQILELQLKTGGECLLSHPTLVEKLKPKTNQCQTTAQSVFYNADTADLTCPPAVTNSQINGEIIESIIVSAYKISPIKSVHIKSEVNCSNRWGGILEGEDNEKVECAESIMERIKCLSETD